MDTYLITGATGFIGGLLVREIVREQQGNVSLILPVRDEACARAAFDGLAESTGAKIQYIPCSVEAMTPDRFSEDIHVDYLLHCASPTQSAYLAERPVETMDAILLGTRNALELARHFGVKSMVFLSSMESYGVVEDIGRGRAEEETGEIPLHSPRSSYPLGKRTAEFLCEMYHREYGLPVKTARLAQVFGKGVRRDDTRVFAQFARAVIEKRDIVLETHGRSMGNYCASEDAVSAILTVLRKGQDGETYNVVNEDNTMTIRAMAELVCREVAGGAIDIRLRPDDKAAGKYAPESGLRMSSEKLQRLGWAPQKGLAAMFQDVIAEFLSP